MKHFPFFLRFWDFRYYLTDFIPKIGGYLGLFFGYAVLPLWSIRRCAATLNFLLLSKCKNENLCTFLVWLSKTLECQSAWYFLSFFELWDLLLSYSRYKKVLYSYSGWKSSQKVSFYGEWGWSQNFKWDIFCNFSKVSNTNFFKYCVWFA